MTTSVTTTSANERTNEAPTDVPLIQSSWEQRCLQQLAIPRNPRRSSGKNRIVRYQTRGAL